MEQIRCVLVLVTCLALHQLSSHQGKVSLGQQNMSQLVDIVLSNKVRFLQLLNSSLSNWEKDFEQNVVLEPRSRRFAKLSPRMQMRNARSEMMSRVIDYYIYKMRLVQSKLRLSASTQSPSTLLPSGSSTTPLFTQWTTPSETSMPTSTITLSTITPTTETTPTSSTTPTTMPTTTTNASSTFSTSFTTDAYNGTTELNAST